IPAKAGIQRIKRALRAPCGGTRASLGGLAISPGEKVALILVGKDFSPGGIQKLLIADVFLQCSVIGCDNASTADPGQCQHMQIVRLGLGRFGYEVLLGINLLIVYIVQQIVLLYSSEEIYNSRIPFMFFFEIATRGNSDPSLGLKFQKHLRPLCLIGYEFIDHGSIHD
ncbi:MAG: hypothetical protein OXU54_07820, partial [Gammaproteobacteria bacterium]|nr:hypothetical protein [Gammaproteobacteria bacterium]